MEWLSLIENTETFKTLASSLAKGGKSALFGVHPSHRAAFAAAAARTLKRPVVVMTATDADAARISEDINVIYGHSVAYPSRDYVFPDAEGTSHMSERARLSALGSLESGTASIVCCSVEAWISRTIPRDRFSSLTTVVKTGDTLNTMVFAEQLLKAGYTRSDIVDGRGCFAIKGGIIDIFPCDSEQPYRLELWGDSVETMRIYDKDSQRKIKDIQCIVIPPASEVIASGEDDASKIEKSSARLRSLEYSGLSSRDAELIRNNSNPPSLDRYLPALYDEFTTVGDYVPGCIMFVCDPVSIASHAKDLMTTQGNIFQEIRKRGLCAYRRQDFYTDYDPNDLPPCVFTDVFARSIGDVRLDSLNSITALPVPKVSGGYSSVMELVTGFLSSNDAVLIFAPTEKSADIYVRDLTAEGISAARLSKKTVPVARTVYVGVGTFSGGFEYPEAKLAVIVLQGKIAQNEKHLTRKKAEKADSEMFGSLEDLKPGDYVVHRNHGIGRYEGVERIDHYGMVKDYIKIQYRDSDTLYLPVEQLNMVSPYISVKEDGPVKLAKLYSGEWQKTKQTVYRSIKEMTKELTELYAKRDRTEGIAFSPDDDWQSDFEARFIYDETDDQLTASREIKSDMQRPRPMDRLLCGDVGVGKTEVALRAAFKCVNDSYQCAVLVPTTILAWQHYSTFIERMSPYPIKIVMLSRFSTQKEIKAAIKGIKDGTVDIAIGTHRLLQKDVEFKRLGLLIVDEEQRFGVSHKEKLKQDFPNVDVLTLSATPIPRTLNMAMSGIRDMSVIEQPPEDRQPVMTYVIEFDQATVDAAISRELARGGQVYYLHNRVDTIEKVATGIMERFPDARVEIAHGKMSEQQLSGVWQRLINNEVDILVCTTIIETGVDVPNCNTLIVENSDRMGLSQLYQIRGRVGRSARRAYAYFTFKRDYVMNEIAEKRLSAIRDFTSFGSGFKIAMRDLQIRGAGGILSARQSGHIATVGYETYLELLEQAVAEEKGEAPKKPRTECVIDLAVNAYIPERFIEDEATRISMYKRIAAITSSEDAADVRDELSDRFGMIPASVSALIDIALCRYIASDAGFYEIRADKDHVYLYKDGLDTSLAGKAAEMSPRKLMWVPKGKSYVSATLLDSDNHAAAALETARILSELGA